jgi:hypothetical protein
MFCRVLRGITLKANSISFGGQSYDVVTAYVEAKGSGEGKRSARKISGGVGLGAIVGGIETRLQFQLNAAVTVKP